MNRHYFYLKSFFILACLQVSLTGNALRAQIITTVTGNGTGAYSGDGGYATAASINAPSCVIADGSGNFYFSDGYNARVRKVNSSGIITTIAGTGTPGYSGDGGPATAAELNGPSAVVLDAAGNIYISDINNNNIRKINTSGVISTFAGAGYPGYSGDGGPATAATFNYVYGLAFDPSGNLYIADEYNHCIRMMNTSGIISTFAGTGSGGYSGDGGPASDAELFYPNYVTFDHTGNLFIMDNTNHRVRKVNTSGIISTYAGNGTRGYSGDGGPATDAQVDFSGGLKFDASGNLFIAEDIDNHIRVVYASGIINTFAGTGTAGFSGDGGPASAATFNGPLDVAFSMAGNLIVADCDNNRIRMITVPANHPPSFVGGPAATITICENSPAYSINSQLAITDADTGQTETWSVATAPVHGALSGFTTTRTSTGGVLTPAGLSYTPVTGYAGYDTFSVSVSDGSAGIVRTIYVNIEGAGSIAGPFVVCVGDTIALTDSYPGGIWNSGNNSLCTISATGQVLGISPGTDTIYYSISADCGLDVAYYIVTVKSAEQCNESASNQQFTAADKMKIYPNPSNGAFTINITSESPQEARVIIKDVLGRKVKDMVIFTNTPHQFNIQLPIGIYVVTSIVGANLVTENLCVDE